jgi:5S rRNA maturation endonuclease (ribonuclease M5)
MNLEPLDLVEQRLRNTVDKVTRRDHSITACCPAHADRNPSLTVSIGDRRDIVLHCFAGCAPDTILQALNLTWKDFGPTEPINQDIHYTYENENGRPLYRVIRSPGKKFWQQHLNADGEWVNGLGNTPRILYRLPQVLDAKNRGLPIWIVEGEKDVERLRRIGLTATCNSGGAGKFLPQHADVLAGAELNIVADRDEPGRQHAQHIAELCEARGCRINLWEPAHGKDITDHLTAGHQIHELTSINTNQLEQEQDDPFRIVNWEQFWTGEHLTEQWCIWPLIPAKRTISLYAPAKAGKSTVVLAVVAAAVAGRPILGTQPTTERPRVLYLDYEMTDADLYERLTELGYGPQDNLEGLAYSLIPNINTLDTDTGAQQVLDKATQHRANLVIIDTFGRAVAGEENSADTVRAFYRLTASRLKAAGIAVLRTDHAGKDLDKGQRGTSAKNDDVDVVWQLRRTDNGVQLNRTHSRIGWIPQQLDITKQDLDDGTTNYTLTTQQRSYPDGTAQLAELLDDLGLAVDTSSRKALEALRQAGHKTRNDKVRAAIQMRRQRLADPLESLWISAQKPVDNSGRGDGAHPTQNTRGAATGRGGAHLEETPREQGEHTGRGNGAHPGAPDLSNRGAAPLSIRGAPTGPAPEQDEEEIF